METNVTCKLIPPRSAQHTRTQPSRHLNYCYCSHPGMARMLVLYYVLLTLIGVSLPSSLHTPPDVCERASIDAAARVRFTDNIEKTFIASGSHYWLVDETSERPEWNASLRLPYNFAPDVAITKDTSKCWGGSSTLFLVQYEYDHLTDHIVWFGLEGKPDSWSNNEPIVWGPKRELVTCDGHAKSCTITDRYLTMARFNLKRKLDAAFGTIGATAYFIQGDKISKIVYHTQCVGDNPAQDMIGYDSIDLATNQVTAALSSSSSLDNVTIVLFDNDIHITLHKQSLDTIKLTATELDLPLWLENAPHFFQACSAPITNVFQVMLSDLFASGSKRHNQAKAILLVVVAAILLIILGIIGLVVIIRLRRSRSRSIRPRTGDVVVASVELETTPITKNDVSINGNDNEKKLLQTSC